MISERIGSTYFPLLPNQMPSLRELERRNYFISVTSHGGDEEYISRRRIYFRSNNFGFIMVKTDKPIYKPEQSGSGLSYCYYINTTFPYIATSKEHYSIATLHALLQ